MAPRLIQVFDVVAPVGNPLQPFPDLDAEAVSPALLRRRRGREGDVVDAAAAFEAAVVEELLDLVFPAAASRESAAADTDVVIVVSASGSLAFLESRNILYILALVWVGIVTHSITLASTILTRHS